MMMKQAKLMAAVGLCALAGSGFGQGGYMQESQAAISMNDTIQGQMPGAGPGMPPQVPGQVPGVGNPGAGFAGAPMGGNTMPGVMGMPGDPTMGGMPGELGATNAQPAIQLPAPIATKQVLTGRRVYDAVSGAMLEDAIKITVRAEDEAAYDNGTNDNGLMGDGIKGNVITSRNEYIGQFSNMVKNELIHAVHNAEQIDPMVYYGHHVAKVNPTRVEGLKRYGLPLPEESYVDYAGTAKVVPDFASVIDLERDRDGLVKQWNDKFLAQYRVNPNDPQSDYFMVFVPTPPLTPSDYPVPTGYKAPQSVAKANKQAADQVAATAAVLASQTTSRGGDVGGGPDLGGGMGGGF